MNWCLKHATLGIYAFGGVSGLTLHYNLTINLMTIMSLACIRKIAASVLSMLLMTIKYKKTHINTDNIIRTRVSVKLMILYHNKCFIFLFITQIKCMFNATFGRTVFFIYMYI